MKRAAFLALAALLGAALGILLGRWSVEPMSPAPRAGRAPKSRSEPQLCEKCQGRSITLSALPAFPAQTKVEAKPQEAPGKAQDTQAKAKKRQTAEPVDNLIVSFEGAPEGMEISLTASGKEDDQSETRSGRSPLKFHLGPGQWILSAETAGGTYIATESPVEVLAQSLVRVLLRFHRCPGLHVWLKAPHSLPDGLDPVVAIAPLLGNSLTPEGKLAIAFDEMNSPDREDQGHLVFEDLKPGEHLLVARYSMGPIKVLRRINVSDQTEPIVITLPPLQASDMVFVKLTGPAGEPVREAEFDLRFESSVGICWTGAVANETSPGLYQIVFPAVNEAYQGLGGSWTLDVRSEAHGGLTRKFLSSQRQIRIAFNAGAKLTARIAGNLERMGENLAVTLDSGDSTIQLDAKLANGVAHFDPVQPGQYKVTLSYSGPSDNSRVYRERQVVLRGGMQEISLAMPKLYQARIGTNLPNGSWLEIESPDSESCTGSARIRGGEAVFEYLPAGRYQITESNSEDGGPGQTITIPGSSLRFDQGKHGALRVQLSGPGHLRDLGLRDGDLILGLVGEPAPSRSSSLKELILKAGGKAVLQVRRGGKRLEISVDGRKLFKLRAHLGGKLSASSY